MARQSRSKHGIPSRTKAQWTRCHFEWRESFLIPVTIVMRNCIERRLSIFEPPDDSGITFAPEAIDIFKSRSLEQMKLLHQVSGGAVHFRRVTARFDLQLAAITF